MRALMIIDVQQGMFSFPGFQPHDGEATVARIAGLLRRARDSATPIFFVQHAGSAEEALSPEKPGFAFRVELAPADDESVTVKKHCNSFWDTDLDQKLKRADIDHLIICGMQSEFCVDTAVRAAVEHGYRVTLVSDGHTTFTNKALSAERIIAHHNATLGSGFATLRSASEIDFARID